MSDKPELVESVQQHAWLFVSAKLTSQPLLKFQVKYKTGQINTGYEMKSENILEFLQSFLYSYDSFYPKTMLLMEYYYLLALPRNSNWFYKNASKTMNPFLLV